MTSQSVFELHSFVGSSAAGSDQGGEEEWLAGTPWQEELVNQSPSAAVIQFPVEEGLDAVWVAIDEATGRPCRAGDGQDAVAGFTVIKRRLGLALAMTTADHAGVLVNGLPALRFTVLSPRDSVVLSPGMHSYITERVRPHVGAPTEPMIGLKCPFCKIAVDADTRVAACRCGVLYHAESAESHPAIAEEDRLNCLSKVRACLSCSRPVALEEFLVWDPGELSPPAG